MLWWWERPQWSLMMVAIKAKAQHQHQHHRNWGCEAILSLPDSFFLMVILHLAWLVISRSGVKSSLMVDLASILTVCQESSLKINNSPRSVSLTRVIRKSAFCQVGLLDSNTILDIYMAKKVTIENMIKIVIFLVKILELNKHCKFP